MLSSTTSTIREDRCYEPKVTAHLVKPYEFNGECMSLVMLSNRVLLKPLKVEETHSSGIVLVGDPSTQKALVVSVGPGRYTENGLLPMQVAEGDVVLIMKHGRMIEVSIEGERLLIISEDEILGIQPRTVENLIDRLDTMVS